MKRRELAKNFLPGDEVETGGRIGRVAESSKIDFERGNVPVLLGRGEAVPYNPMVLRNLSKEKRERGEERFRFFSDTILAYGPIVYRLGILREVRSGWGPNARPCPIFWRRLSRRTKNQQGVQILS